MRIGTFRSLSNPKKRYAIFRLGAPRKSGGEGIRWKCSCLYDASSNDNFDNPCKHLRCLWAYAKHNELKMLLDSGFITLTKSGTRYFGKKVDAVE